MKSVPSTKPHVVKPLPLSEPNASDPSGAAPSKGPNESVKDRAPTDVIVGTADQSGAARRLRKSRARRLLIRLGVFVFLPTLVSAIYYYRLASPQFESVALVTIYSADTLSPTQAGISALVGLGSASSPVMDGLSVREYILSRDILRRLNEEHGFIEHFRDPNRDWVSRLPLDATFEDAYLDYEDRVRVEIDPNSGVGSLSVLAYSPEAAQQFATAIIEYSEEMVNHLSERARQDQVEFAQREVEKAEERLKNARQALVAVQQERGEFNPELSAQAQLQIRTALEAETAKARAELAQLTAIMTPNAPEVVSARERVRSLSGQIAATSQRMVAKGEGQSLNKSASVFEAALVEKEFSTMAYQSALTSLETARAQANRKLRYLATISPPSVADESMHPSRHLRVLTVFLGSFLLMGIGSLLIAAVKEHSRL